MDQVLRLRLLSLVQDDQSVRHSLTRLRDSDPDMRAKLDSLTDPHASDIGVINWTYPGPVPQVLLEMHEVDRRNLAELREVIQRLCGWPGHSLAGDDGAEAASLIVLHADRDRAFQRQCLTMLKAAVTMGEAELWHLERLEDRLDVAERCKPRHRTS
jgi:hypothetical protein